MKSAHRPGEVVHHKNRNKSDDSMDNLWVFRNQDAHDRAHKIDAASMKISRMSKKMNFRMSSSLVILAALSLGTILLLRCRRAANFFDK
jgi:hypothetical protein